jgi:hypothetical protein
VKRLIRCSSTVKLAPDKTPSNKIPSQTTIEKKPTALAGFTFNSIARKEDLL